MSNEDDECDSASLFTMGTQVDVNSFLRSQAAKITRVTSSISDDDDSSMDGSLVARLTQLPQDKKLTVSHPNVRLTPVKPCVSRSCFASLSSSSPAKTHAQKLPVADDLTELKWLNTFKLKEFKDDLNANETKDKDVNEKLQSATPQSQQDSNNNDEDRLAKLISELKSYDHESTKINTPSLGILIFLALYSKRDEKQLAWSLTIKQLYEYAQLNAKQITSKRGWKNLLRQALITIPCFVKTKRDLLKSRSLWTIDPYYRPLLTKAYLTIPPAQPSTATTNKTLSEAATNRHEDQLDASRSSQSVVNNFAPKATVKTKVLPRLYERLCEEKADEDGDEADSSNLGRRHRSLTTGRKRPRSSTSSGHRSSGKDHDGKRRLSTSPWASKLLKRHKRRHHRSSDVEPKTSTPNRGFAPDTASSAISTVVTPSPSLDHNYMLPTEQNKHAARKPASLERTKSTGSVEYNDPSSDEESDDDDDDDDDEDDERDSSAPVASARKSIITTRAQAAARNHSKNRRKSSPPKKRLALQLPSHRPNTRINRRIIEHDLKLLRQANVLPPLSPPSNQQPLDLSLGPNRSSSFEDATDRTTSMGNRDGEDEAMTSTSAATKTTPMEGVLDLSLSR